jgi:DNA helicase INO80
LFLNRSASGNESILGVNSISGDSNLNLAEDAAEQAILREEAIRAAQNAAFQQKEKTDAFDIECSKLREKMEPGHADTAPDMDLLHP